jgi:vancomycin resistance protein VanW
MQQTREPLSIPTVLAPKALAAPRLSRYTLPLVVLGASLLAGGALVASLATAPPSQQKLSAFSTNLRGRSLNQRRNALLAARSIDGRVVAPHAVFSFNQTVRSWSVDQGYVKALVSYDGELVRAYGGGVCQTSTTLYNAALLAGLPVLERHPHVFVPHYIVPGRDAAVAFPGIDLRFRNSNPWPIRIHAVVRGDRLEVWLTGAKAAAQKVSINTEMLSVSTPIRLTRVINRKAGASSGRRSYVHSAGTAGYRVVTFRSFSTGRRESLSDDTYPAMNRVIALSREVPQGQ